MCNCDMGNGPSAYSSRVRTARKQHRCFECGKSIMPSQMYEYASGIWDGEPSSFKTCMRCVALRTAHVKADERAQEAAIEREQERYKAHLPVFMTMSADGRAPAPQLHFGRIEPCRPVFGDLLNSIGECARDDKAYVRFFREAYREVCAT